MRQEQERRLNEEDEDEHDHEQGVYDYSYTTQPPTTIRSFLDQTSLTRTAFLKEISKTLPNQSNGKSLTAGPPKFTMLKSGVREGNQNLVYYTAYICFEKLRIHDGSPERNSGGTWGMLGYDGFDRNRKPRYICLVGRDLCPDEFGEVYSVPACEWV
ncbi:hypothetical protein BDW68DRAFT_183240 [Aspergillus falconensis]